MIVADLSTTEKKLHTRKKLEMRKEREKKKIASRSLCVFVGFSVLMLRARLLLLCCVVHFWGVTKPLSTPTKTKMLAKSHKHLHHDDLITAHCFEAGLMGFLSHCLEKSKLALGICKCPRLCFRFKGEVFC